MLVSDNLTYIEGLLLALTTMTHPNINFGMSYGLETQITELSESAFTSLNRGLFFTASALCHLGWADHKMFLGFTRYHTLQSPR